MTNNSHIYTCAECAIEKDERICTNQDGIGPGNCPTLNDEKIVARALEYYEDEKTLRFALEASRQEAECYVRENGNLKAVKCRVEEVCEFAKRMGYTRLGLAFCSGFINEAKLLVDILKSRDFEVVSAVCKAGCIEKEHINVSEDEKINPGTFESMCNPIAQAMLLNEAQTDFNIMMGLCVGHDSLFLKHVEAYTTVLAVKDRMMGHNPIAALYTSNSYNRRLKE